MKDIYRVDYRKQVRYGAKRLKEEAIRKLLDNRYKIRMISTAKALDEGANLPALNVGLICSGTSSKRKQVQRIGRVIRLTSPDKEAIVVNLVIRGTQDHKWYNSRVDGLKIDKVFTKIEDLYEAVNSA